MSAPKQCSFCGGKPRGRAISHDGSCPARHAARRDARAASSNLPDGPLTPPHRVPTSYALGTGPRVAEWLAFVGLRGQFCFVQGRGWLQWTGAAWKPSSVEHVRKGIRRSSEDLHARLEKEARADGTLTEARRAKFYPLLDVNRAFDLMPLIKSLVSIDGGQR